MPKNLSVSVNTTYRKQFSSRNDYQPSQTIVFHLNCNTAVDPRKSYLKMDVQVTGAGVTANWTVGSVMNLIKEVRILSKNGTELDRIQSYNMWAVQHLRNCVDQDYLTEYGSLFGFQESTHAAPLIRTYIIPMPFVSGLFRPYGGVKLPPSLLSGARVELVLEETAQAFSAVVGAGYTVFNPEICLSEHTLSDNVLKILAETSANSGLEIMYPRVFSAVENNGTSTQFSTQVKKAVSQCTKIVVKPVDTSKLNVQLEDSFRSVDGSTTFSKYQFRLASNFYPFQEVKSIQEAFMNSSCACDQDRVHPIVSFANYFGGDFYLASQIKADSDISASGIPINNSSSLAINMELQPSVVNKSMFIFMEYSALARSFLSQTSVKI